MRRGLIQRCSGMWSVVMMNLRRAGMSVMFFGCMVAVAVGQKAAGARLGDATVVPASPQQVWLDTVIGVEIDDAFALGLIMRSPELKLVGISTAFGDTELRARLVDRYLAGAGLGRDVPVTAGVHTVTDNVMTQAAYARRSPARAHGDGVTALLTAIRANPGKLTLIAIGPLFNIGEAIRRDPGTFRQLRRVVLMGGSIDRGYDGEKGERRGADAEWNINRDPAGAQALVGSGVPLYMMPLDSTQVRMDKAGRAKAVAAGTPVADQVALLYQQWSAGTGYENPTLYDPVAVAASFKPELCPATPMRIAVDEKGYTRKLDGEPNAEVCLESKEKEFLELLETRLATEK